LFGVVVEASDHAQATSHGCSSAPTRFEVTGEALDVGPAGAEQTQVVLGAPGIYIKGAVSTGLAVDEIQEVLLQATVYCGTPAGRQAFLAAHEAPVAAAAVPSPSAERA
jgi:hypothetical protein